MYKAGSCKAIVHAWLLRSYNYYLSNLMKERVRPAKRQSHSYVVVDVHIATYCGCCIGIDVFVDLRTFSM